MKIAFTEFAGPSSRGEWWTAAAVYLRNLAEAIRCADGATRLYTLAVADQAEARSRAQASGLDDAIWHQPPPRWRPLWAAAWAARHTGHASLPVEWTLRRMAVDVVCCLTPMDHAWSRFPSLGWLADFQHVHLPEMFSDAERKVRDRSYLATARFADRVLLISESVRRDYELFAPTYAHKARVVKPVAIVPPSIYADADLPAVVARYNLPDKFFYAPNQFWVHKNHATLFRAIKLLNERDVAVTLVCSGNSYDYRNTEHFAQLMVTLSEWNIRSRVIYLGLIPHDDVLRLVRQSVCVVNPSLFEGFGYSVEEARAVGKRVLVSDIPAHREQCPPRATFFNPRDPYELAHNLQDIWLESPPGPDRELECGSRRLAPERLRAYGAGFLEIAREVVGSRVQYAMPASV